MNRMQKIIAKSGDVTGTTGEKMVTSIRHQQIVSVNLIGTKSAHHERRSRQSLLAEFGWNEVETA